MSKVYKFIFIVNIIFILISYASITYAANINMNLDSTTTTTTQPSSSTTSTNSSSSTNNSSTGNTSNSSSSSQFSTAVSTANFDLKLTNILIICLIVVGVLLVLFSIAILIRLKK